MKIVECEQGSSEWHAARLGIPTASEFGRLITKTGKPSTQSNAYANQLVAEWLCGHALDGFESDWMRRGKELEAEARAYYELQTGAEVLEVGFVLRDDERVGCSPDGLIGDEGLLEIKCPAPHTHVEYLLTGAVPAQYVPQVQGQLYVTGARWCDFLSYHPDMPPVLLRIERDDTFIARLYAELAKLIDTVDARKAKLAERGIAPSEAAA